MEYQTLQLYKLITNELGHYIDEFGWELDEKFYIWVNYLGLTEFIKHMKDIFGNGLFDDGSFNANVQEDCLCINLCEALCGFDIELEDVFPKDKYKH